MVTKVAGTVAVVHGSDTFVAGLRQMISGSVKQTLTQQAIVITAETAGARPETAQTIGAIGDTLIGLGATVGVNAITTPTAVAPRVSAAAAARLRASGVKGGIVDSLVVPNGLKPRVFLGMSTRAGGGGKAALEPTVATVAMRRPSRFNFGCGEGQSLSQAIAAKVNPAGGASSARIVATGAAKEACDNCKWLLEYYGVEDVHAP